jgi:hypothetical protein
MKKEEGPKRKIFAKKKGNFFEEKKFSLFSQKEGQLLGNFRNQQRFWNHFLVIFFFGPEKNKALLFFF